MLIYASSCPDYFAEHGGAFVNSAQMAGHRVQVDLTTNYPQLRKMFKSERLFSMHLRYLRLPDLLENDDVLMLDIDSIINQPIRIENCDMALFFRPWIDDPYRKILMTASYWTQKAKPFAERVRGKMLFRDNQWYDDQLIVWETYQEIGGQFVIKGLDSTFANYEFDRDTPIWTCKGPERKTNKTYLARRATYV